MLAGPLGRLGNSQRKPSWYQVRVAMITSLGVRPYEILGRQVWEKAPLCTWGKLCSTAHPLKFLNFSPKLTF